VQPFVAPAPAQPDYFLRAKQAMTERMKDPDSVKFGKLYADRAGPDQEHRGHGRARRPEQGYEGIAHHPPDIVKMR
jgi:hypothetical protein